jgi:hypothetical protein
MIQSRTLRVRILYTYEAFLEGQKAGDEARECLKQYARISNYSAMGFLLDHEY